MFTCEAKKRRPIDEAAKHINWTGIDQPSVVGTQAQVKMQTQWEAIKKKKIFFIIASKALISNIGDDGRSMHLKPEWRK